MTDHRVTGAQVAVDLTVDCPQETMWGRVIDVSRIGEWSPECYTAQWLTTPDSDPPTGARFEGRNRFPNGFESQVVCVVTAAERPRVFEWTVLDASGDPDRPGTTWRYELRPGPAAGQTSVRQSFLHGPGSSGLRTAVEEDIGHAASIVAGRLCQLRRHMIQTITAMARA